MGGGNSRRHRARVCRPSARRPLPTPGRSSPWWAAYQLAPGAFATVTKDGDALMWQGGRRPKVRLWPVSETRFYAEDTDLEMTFHASDKGLISHVTLRQGICQDSELKRVE